MTYDLSSFVSNTTSLKLILEEYSMRIWIVSSWLGEGSNGGSLHAGNLV